MQSITNVSKYNVEILTSLVFLDEKVVRWKKNTKSLGDIQIIFFYWSREILQKYNCILKLWHLICLKSKQITNLLKNDQYLIIYFCA